MSTILDDRVRSDFDRLARLDSDGWTANNHYHDFLLRSMPLGCEYALEVGCGTGAFARRLAAHAQHVLAIDLSPEMIRIARCRCEQTNIDFEVADIASRHLPAAHFDYIASIATLHHTPQLEVISKLKDALRPGGTIAVIDLLEPERNLFTLAGIRHNVLNLTAMGVSCGLRLIHNGRLRPPRAVRAAWEEHGKTDCYLRMREVRALHHAVLPGAEIRKRLLWRYSVVWRKP